MTMTSNTAAATVPPSGTEVTTTPERQFALHVCSGERDLLWHYQLGQLALVCCPQGTPDRTRRLKALAAGCSLTLLYKVMKFAIQYKTAKVRKLQQTGLRWDLLANLLSVPPAKRARAITKVLKLRPSSRGLRRWKAGRYGPVPPRGRRPARPLPGYSPDVQAREVINDCRRLCAWHRFTPDVFGRVLRNLEAGILPTPQELALMQAAVGALDSLVDQFGGLRSLLQQVTTCEELTNPTATGARRCRSRRGTNQRATGRPKPRG